MTRFEKATLESVDAVLALMPLYYEYDHLDFDPVVARRSVGELVASPDLGQLWLIVDSLGNGGSGRLIGYMAIVYIHSLEFGGKAALIDELFLLEEFRGKGAGSQAIERGISECQKTGVNVVQLEVTPSNSEALKLYQKLGFKDVGRTLLTYRS